ncbi:MAG: HAD-IG family 5'-nucleotidase [Oligoflexia bacterium]
MIPAYRKLFCNRTLNLRSIQAIGYDMDYTLVHYDAIRWEETAYQAIQTRFVADGWPIADFKFDPNLICRGLVIDMERGNLVKANRFGFIKRAIHGTHLMDFDRLRQEYSRTIVDLNERRWLFLNTLFSLSEGCLYAQLVDVMDAGRAPERLSYTELYRKVRRTLDEAHAVGTLKAQILGDPDRFVQLDPEVALTLLDQKGAGKKLLLITNSEWQYTRPIMEFAFDRYLPHGMKWRDLFDYTIVSAKKPDFFTLETPFFEVADDTGMLRPDVRSLKSGGVYYGGSAKVLERSLGISGDQILYIGDHMFGDVKVTKSVLRWRTALVLRELEEEIAANTGFSAHEQELAALMREKEACEAELCQVRLMLQRFVKNYGPSPTESLESLEAHSLQLKQKLEELDEKIAPIAQSSTALSHPLWGPLMRTGSDKSHLAFQVERYADIYTSKVSNFLAATPFIYLRSARGSLPHD